jgi:hypothetical protein
VLHVARWPPSRGKSPTNKTRAPSPLVGLRMRLKDALGKRENAHDDTEHTHTTVRSISRQGCGKSRRAGRPENSVPHEINSSRRFGKPLRDKTGNRRRTTPRPKMFARDWRRMPCGRRKGRSPTAHRIDGVSSHTRAPPCMRKAVGPSRAQSFARGRRFVSVPAGAPPPWRRQGGARARRDNTSIIGFWALGCPMPSRHAAK